MAEAEAKPKQSLGDRIKTMSLGGLLGSAAVVLVVGLVIGLGAGYKIEQQRTKNAVKDAKAAAKKSTPSSQGTPGAATTVRLIGTVGTASADTVTVTVGGGTATQRFVTSATTTVVKATQGRASDITAGSRVVWKAKPGEITNALEVIVLPADAKLGSAVVNATGDSMTLKTNGKNVTVSTQGATIDKVTTAKTSDIATGAKVVAEARRTNQSLSAIEVILLPPSTKFVE